MTSGEGIPEIPTETAAAPEIDLGPIGPKHRYEFTPEQDKTIGDLAGKMGFVGAFLLAMTTLGLIQVGVAAWKYRRFDSFAALNALLYGCIAIWTLAASGAFAAVVTTAGRDVSHLMDALSSLRKMYSLLYWLLVIAIVASLILLLSSVFRGTA